MISHKDGVFSGFRDDFDVGLLLVEGTVARCTLGWLVAWPHAAVVVPAWWMLRELGRAVNDFVVNIWVVPVKTLEVVAAFSQGCVLECIAIAIFIWVLAANHPPGAGLWSSQCAFHAHLVAGVGLTGGCEVETWSSNIEVVLSIAD